MATRRTPPSRGSGGTPPPTGGARPPANAPVAPAAARAAAPASKPPAWEARFRQLESQIEQFRIDGERFFSGGLQLPPEELRDRIARALRELQGVQIRSAVDQFRLGGLEARFASLSEHFARRLRDREEGRGAPAPRIAAEPPRYDLEAGVVLGGAPEAGAVEALWRRLAASGGRQLDLESFRGYLEKQIGDIRSRTGAGSVQFRVVEEEGKLKLKAKPLAGGEG